MKLVLHRKIKIYGNYLNEFAKRDPIHPAMSRHLSVYSCVSNTEFIETAHYTAEEKSQIPILKKAVDCLKLLQNLYLNIASLFVDLFLVQSYN